MPRGVLTFNLFAIVEDQFHKLSDKPELSKRKRNTLERKLNGTYRKGGMIRSVVSPSF